MLPFLLGSGESRPGFHQGCEEAAGRLTQRIGRVQFQCPTRKKKTPSKPKQTVFMISTSQHSIILLPVPDRPRQPLPRKQRRDGDAAPVPPAAALGSEGQRSPRGVPERTLPSHGSRECGEGRAVLGPSEQSAGSFLWQREVVKKTEQIPPRFRA